MDRFANTISNGHGGKDLAPIRSMLKFVALSVLAMAGWLRVRLAAGPSLIILTYHRVLPGDHPDRKHEQPGMVVAPETLRRHIRLLRESGATPTHLGSWLDAKLNSEPLPRLSFALTFDDGWRDNFQYAYPILKEEHIPATIFLVTRLLDTNRTFWPEQVLRLLTTRVISATTPEFQWLLPFLPQRDSRSTPLNLEEADGVINRLKALDDATILAHLEKIPTDSDQNSRSMDARTILNSEELREMADSGLIRFGAHTQHHYRLNRLKETSSLKKEIVDCLQDLKDLGGAVTPIFCYPNGDITEAGEDLVEQHYQAACTTKTGWNRGNTDPFNLHRFTIHDGNSFSNRRLLALLGRGSL